MKSKGEGTMNYPDCNCIKDVRKKNHFNQAHMAYFLGVGIRKYREMELGHESFSQYEMIKMMLLFNLDEEDVFHLFFDKDTNRYLYVSNNLLRFDRKKFLSDFDQYNQKDNLLFYPWNPYNKKASRKKKEQHANEK